MPNEKQWGQMNLVTTDAGVEIIAPTIHMNGSGKASLKEGYLKALEGIRTARSGLESISPHGRDYYVQDPSGAAYGPPIERAALEHRARLMKLNEIEAELTAILLDVCN